MCLRQQTFWKQKACKDTKAFFFLPSRGQLATYVPLYGIHYPAMRDLSALPVITFSPRERQQHGERNSQYTFSVCISAAHFLMHKIIQCILAWIWMGVLVKKKKKRLKVVDTLLTKKAYCILRLQVQPKNDNGHQIKHS